MNLRLLVLGTGIAGLLASQIALAGGHNQARAPAVAQDQELTAQIDAVLNEYAKIAMSI